MTRKIIFGASLTLKLLLSMSHTAFPILIIITTVIIAVYCKQVRSRQSASRPLYAFQTTSTPSQGNAFALHQIAATHPSVPVGYQPVPQTTQIPPGYHLHPMQSAVPVQTKHDTSETRLRLVQVGITPGHLSQNTQGSRLSPRPSPRHSPRHSPGHSPRHSPRPSSRHSPTHSLRHPPTIDQDDPPPPYESVVKPVDSS